MTSPAAILVTTEGGSCWIRGMKRFAEKGIDRAKGSRPARRYATSAGSGKESFRVGR